MARACSYLHRWLQAGLDPVPVSVNVSRYDLLRDDFIQTITALTSDYRLPNSLLHLEITESAFSGDTEQLIHVVEQLVSLKFIVEIDDFGSGYSSLNTLKDVPAQVLKLDIGLIESSRNSLRGGSIIEAVLQMAKWLSMAVIAEGVETLEQADYLKSIGCEYVQGYLYSRPIPVEEYEKYLSACRSKSLPG